jgi:hypothetical protein
MFDLFGLMARQLWDQSEECLPALLKQGRMLAVEDE